MQILATAAVVNTVVPPFLTSIVLEHAVMMILMPGAAPKAMIGSAMILSKVVRIVMLRMLAIAPKKTHNWLK